MASAVASQPKFATLADRLMALGGAHVVATFEEDLDTLLGRGSVREGPVRFLKGRASHCHANAAALYEADPANRVVTGWALSEDGLWRQHSWCERARSLVETTERRVAYFGIELGDDEADEFCFNNL
jgi:hypothetical protein